MGEKRGNEWDFSNVYNSLVYWQDRDARRMFHVRDEEGRCLVQSNGMLRGTHNN